MQRTAIDRHSTSQTNIVFVVFRTSIRTKINCDIDWVWRQRIECLWWKMIQRKIEYQRCELTRLRLYTLHTQRVISLNLSFPVFFTKSTAFSLSFTFRFSRWQRFVGQHFGQNWWRCIFRITKIKTFIIAQLRPYTSSLAGTKPLEILACTVSTHTSTFIFHKKSSSTFCMNTENKSTYFVHLTHEHTCKDRHTRSDTHCCTYNIIVWTDQKNTTSRFNGSINNLPFFEIGMATATRVTSNGLNGTDEGHTIAIITPSFSNPIQLLCWTAYSLVDATHSPHSWVCIIDTQNRNQNEYTIHIA